MKRVPSLILALLITSFLILNLYLMSSIEKPKRQTALVTRVIDGDTIEVNGDETVRLLNINTPEKTEKGYDSALKFLSSFEDQKVEIEFLGTDKYDRTLARIYVPDYLNLKLVSLGLATKFLVDEQELRAFKEAEDLAVDSQSGLWIHSKFYGCFNSNIFPDKELITISISCPNINLKDWVIRDESRKKYKLPKTNKNKLNIHSGSGENNETDIFLGSSQPIWNNDRDTLYLLDIEGGLAYHETYGY